MPDPNNYYLEQYNVVFQMICKAGNTSMKWMLIDTFIKNEHDKIAAAKDPSKFFNMISKDAIPDDAYVIGFCRHPVARLISCWKDKVNGLRFHTGFRRRHRDLIKHHMSFPDFVNAIHQIDDSIADQHFRSQTTDLNLSRNDSLICIEYCYEQWKTVRNKLEKNHNLILPELYHRNRTKQAESFYIEVETLNKIFDRYEKDFDLLKYERHNPFDS